MGLLSVTTEGAIAERCELTSEGICGGSRNGKVLECCDEVCEGHELGFGDTVNRNSSRRRGRRFRYANQGNFPIGGVRPATWDRVLHIIVQNLAHH